jgi:hypothetical protein
MAALLLPLRLLTAESKPGKPPVPVSAVIIRDAIKWRNREVDAVAALHEEAPGLAALQQALAGTSGSGAQLALVLSALCYVWLLWYTVLHLESAIAALRIAICGTSMS